MRNKASAILNSDKAMSVFFNKVPWVLSGPIQQKDALLRCLDNEAERLSSMNLQVRFSLLTPMYNTEKDHLRELIATCLLQTYQNWELILVDDGSPKPEHLEIAEAAAKSDSRIKFFRLEKNAGISAARNVAISHATGDFVCVLDHDDLIHPQILGIFARTVATDRSLNFIFCNEVKISNESTQLSDFYSKPGFSYPTLLRTNYICHFTAIKMDLLKKSRTPDGHYFVSKNDGFEDHHLFIRLAEVEGFKAKHIPVYGYYWRKAATSTATNIGVKPDVWKRGRQMLLDHLGESVDIAITGDRGANGLHSLFFTAKGFTGKLSVLVPFRDKVELTMKGLRSLEAQDYQGPTEVILIDNGSVESATRDTIQAWIKAQHKFKYTLVRDDGAFNYSRLNNRVVASHCGDADYLFFLNNDVELQSANAMTAMVSEMVRQKEIGATGMRLMQPAGGELQHGGMGLNMNAGRLFRPTHLAGPRDFVFDEHVVFCVTFASAMVRAELFRKVGGFDESFFANGLSDVDLCCKIKSLGHEIFYFGTLWGTHKESATRKSQVEDFEIVELNERHSAVLNESYIRQFGYDFVSPEFGGEDGVFDLPFRYKMADMINYRLKTVLGPLHGSIKRLAKSKI